MTKKQILNITYSVISLHNMYYLEIDFVQGVDWTSGKTHH